MDTASSTVAESTSSQLTAGLEGDDDYGYGENNSSSSAVVLSTVQVKAEAMNFLSDADKSLWPPCATSLSLPCLMAPFHLTFITSAEEVMYSSDSVSVFLQNI